MGDVREQAGQAHCVEEKDWAPSRWGKRKLSRTLAHAKEAVVNAALPETSRGELPSWIPDGLADMDLRISYLHMSPEELALYFPGR